jgi:Family of unknown function (DUF5706)
MTTARPPRSRCYFGEVRRYNTETAYVQAVVAQPEDALLRELAGQVYQVSKICHRKHAWTQLAYLLSVAFLMPGRAAGSCWRCSDMDSNHRTYDYESSFARLDGILNPADVN